MPDLKELLMGSVVSHFSDDVSVKTIFGDGAVVGLYFGAGWCSPCRAFTPELIEFYNRFKRDNPSKPFEIIFVSSDNSVEEFEETYSEMTWLALNYTDRDLKGKLTKRFKVKDIPALVLLDGSNGLKLTDEGRLVVTNDPFGKEFPWKSKPFSDTISGILINNKGEGLPSSTLSGKFKGIYFAAHWCPPCKAFTPDLVRSYEKLRKDGKDFEIVYCSSDRCEQSFDEYFRTMPWLAVPYDDQRSEKIKCLLGVSGIPTLVILDPEDNIITKSGRMELLRDPEGEEFPWYPRALNELNEYVSHQLNESVCVILFTEGEEQDITMAIDALQETADLYYDKHCDNEEQELLFFYGGADEICDHFREYMQLEDRNPLLIISDIPERKMFVSPSIKIDRQVIREFIQAYFHGELVPRIVDDAIIKAAQ